MSLSPCVRPLALASLLLLLPACSSDGDAGLGSQNPIAPPPTLDALPFTPGLMALAAGSGSVFVHWSLPDSGLEVGLFQSIDANQVYDDPPIAEALAGNGMQIDGLVDGTTYFFGLGVREPGELLWVPSGIVLRGRPDAPFYVDADADPVGADGTTPATAYPSLAVALVEARQAGVGNLLVREGSYLGDGLEVDADMHLYGGFDATFELANRDPMGNVRESLIIAASGTPALHLRTIGPSVAPAVLDGFAIRSPGDALSAIALEDIGSELRSLRVGNFLEDGALFLNTRDDIDLELRISASTFDGNGGKGVSLEGAFDLYVHGSTFDSNGDEGLAAGPIRAVGFERSVIRIEGSRFFGNGTDGLDLELRALDTPNGPSGFDLEIRGSRFERNGVNGIDVLHGFEGVQGYDADVVVRESLARANRGRGVSIAANGEGGTLVHRSLATANGQEGFFLSSGSITGLGVLSACAATANQNVGARSVGGAKPWLATHCVFAGNLLGGLHNNVAEGTVASSVAYLQRQAYFRTRMAGSIEVDQAQTSTFFLVPVFFTRATTMEGNRIRVEDPSGIFPGDLLEIADDGTEYLVVNVTNGEVVLDPQPATLTLPATVTVHPTGLGVDEDYRLPVGSPARDVGLAEPNADPVDAGIFGSPDAGDPGDAESVATELFYPIDTNPSLVEGLPRTSALQIRFNRLVAPSSVLLGRVRAVTEDGTELATPIMSVNDELVLLPPQGDWGVRPFVVELHLGLAANDGTTLTTPMILPVRPR